MSRGSRAQQPQQHQPYVLVYSTRCTNCARFMDSLSRTSAAASVRCVDMATLHPSQLARISAVPALVQPDGTALVGTKAFEWLRPFEAEMSVDGFDGENGMLAFSNLDDQGYATYATGYGPFEAVR